MVNIQGLTMPKLDQERGLQLHLPHKIYSCFFFTVKLDLFGGHKNKKNLPTFMVKILGQTTTKFSLEMHLI